MQEDDLPSKTQPHAGAGWFCREEGQEDVVDQFLGDARSIVRDGDPDACRACAPVRGSAASHAKNPFAAHGVNRVADQIIQHFSELSAEKIVAIDEV